MSVTCQDLLPLKYFDHIKLVAGHNGLDRTVTWPYVGQTSTVSQWVHGGELLFITGIAHSADKLKGLIWECIQKKLSGLVILGGNGNLMNILDAGIHIAQMMSIEEISNEGSNPLKKAPHPLEVRGPGVFKGYLAVSASFILPLRKPSKSKLI